LAPSRSASFSIGSQRQNRRRSPPRRRRLSMATWDVPRHIPTGALGAGSKGLRV